MRAHRPAAVPASPPVPRRTALRGAAATAALAATASTAAALTAAPATAGAGGAGSGDAGAGGPGAGAGSGAPGGAAEALARLLVGNARFAQGTPRHPHQTPHHRRRVARGQRPFAVVLGCADSRAPAELVFDQGIGDLFDIRVAGHVLDDTLLGSVEFAVDEFDPPLLLVLGHERCGAVSGALAAIESGDPPRGHVASIVDALRPVLAPIAHSGGAHAARVERGVRANARWVAAQLPARSTVVARQAAAGALAVRPARYDLDTGRVTLLG